MKLHEYQAKALLQEIGVPIPRGRVAATPEEAEAVTRELGGRAVLKAQVHAGGRGKAGGVRVVDSPQQAREVAASLLGKSLVTHQTGPRGAPVRRLLVEEAMGIAKELYLSILVDGATGGPVVIASEAGGMEIEEVAAQSPEKILREIISPALGLVPFQGRRLAYGMGLEGKMVTAFADMAARLYQLFIQKDCSLVEINPLVITDDGRLLCLDAKVNLEDDALFRHPELVELRDAEQEDPLEVEASSYGIQYIRLDGNVGCMVNGAGLAMATMDTTLAAGASPANFLDVGGGADEAKVAQAFKLILSDPKVEGVLINIFGGILRCDVVARGILQAAQEVEVKVPIVVRMLGTNVEEGRRLLSESSLPVTFADTLEEAAQKVREATAK